MLNVTTMLVSLFVSSPDTHSERRLDTDLTVSQLKVRFLSTPFIEPPTDIT